MICNGPKFLPDSFDTITNPYIIAAILSEGTADFDKGLKFDLYRHITSLQEYVLIDSRQLHVIHYTKNEDASLTMHEFKSMQNSLFLKTIGMQFLIADCYVGLSM